MDELKYNSSHLFLQQVFFNTDLFGHKRLYLLSEGTRARI